MFITFFKNFEDWSIKSTFNAIIYFTIYCIMTVGLCMLLSFCVGHFGNSIFGTNVDVLQLVLLTGAISLISFIAGILFAHLSNS